MGPLADLTVVVAAGPATGLGAVPVFPVEEICDRWTVALWGVASGITPAASVVGPLEEGPAAADAGCGADGAVADG